MVLDVRSEPDKANGRDLHNATAKFKPIEHPHLPPSDPAWTAAFSAVDLTQLSKDKWEYWFPEATMVIGPCGENSDYRLKNYLRNWLWIRDSWFHAQSQESSAFAPIPPAHWRDWLQQEGKPIEESNHSKLAERRRLVFKRFHELLIDKSPLQPSIDTVTWAGMQYESPTTVTILQQVAWELTEAAFRVELYHLDVRLVRSKGGFSTISG